MIKLKDNEQRSKNAILTMWLILGGVILGLLIELYSIKVLFDLKNSAYGDILYLAEGLQSAPVLMLLGLGGLILVAINVIGIVYFIMWFRRAYWNLHQLTGGLQYTEGWAAGAWFIPIFNWFGPYQIAKELFTKSEDLLVAEGITERSSNRFKVLGIWWALWIISSILGSISGQGDKIDDLDVQIIFGFLGVIGSLISIVAAIFAVKMIKEYHKLELLLPHLKSGVETVKQDNNDLLDAGM